MKYTIATRGSKLALQQSNNVKDSLSRFFPDDDWQLSIIKTTGDRVQDRPLIEFGGKGAFLKEIEEAMLANEADLAVHSLKDVPGVETTGLTLASFLKREDARDVWVSRKVRFADAAAGLKVGTSSLRRTVLVHDRLPGSNVEMLRGNLDTRLRKLNDGDYDAIVVAAAGLNRLKLFDAQYMEQIPANVFIPAIGQGIVTVQTRSNAGELIGKLKRLNDPEAETAARIEREFLSFYDGGCHLPIGGHARRESTGWVFEAFVGGAKTGKIVKGKSAGDEPAKLASAVYEDLQSRGASQLLAELES